MAFLRRGRCFVLTHACDSYFFNGEARAPRTCAKGIFRIGGDGKVYPGCVPEAINPVCLS